MTADADRYHFSDFTHSNYSRLIQLAKERFEFTTYDDFEGQAGFVLWRHDVDFSISCAHTLASLENELDVVATYFLYLHSEFYNLIGETTARLVREIVAMGHRIGLHFSPAFYDLTSEAELDIFLAREKEILSNIFGVDIGVFSFHNPNELILSWDRKSYANLKNTYSKTFKTDISYCSDSNGYWRYARLEEVLRDPSVRCLQVLTHPGWWQKQSLSPRDRINNILKIHTESVQKNYDIGLEVDKRLNIR